VVEFFPPNQIKQRVNCAAFWIPSPINQSR
jgi:hypothetical protein